MTETIGPNSKRSEGVAPPDMRSCDWQSVIAGIEEKECHRYASEFAKKMQEAEVANAKTEYQVYRLLTQVASLMLRESSAAEPFGPMAVFEGSRSAILDDLSDEQLKALEDVLFEVRDPEFRARIADVLWLTRRNYKAALLAVESYLQSATYLEDPDHWTQSAKRIERALRLATTLGQGGKEVFEKVVAHIADILDRYKGEDPLFLSHKLMELLIEFDQGDPVRYAALSEKAARLAEGKSEWHRARSYWETKAKWCAKSDCNEENRNALIKAAETYVSEANSASSALAAATHMQRGIEAFRRIGESQERVAELYQELLEYQRRIPEEMTPVSTQFDASEAIKQARNAVSGKSLAEAIKTLCLIAHPARVDQLRKQVEEDVKNHPLQYLVAAAIVDSDGRVIARMPDLLSGNPEEREEAMRAHMIRHADFHYTVEVQAAIEPARRQIVLEHPIAPSDLMPFLANNPLVRPGREYLYAEALWAGFLGDWVRAAHLMIPQFEDSMRFFLQKMEVATSGMDQKGVQDERSLNKTLLSPELQQAFGPDISFDLRSLLIERFGNNLRNNLAHGLMSHGAFYSYPVIYLWWLILRLICWPTIVAMVKKEETTKAPEIGNNQAETENGEA